MKHKIYISVFISVLLLHTQVLVSQELKVNIIDLTRDTLHFEVINPSDDTLYLLDEWYPTFFEKERNLQMLNYPEFRGIHYQVDVVKLCPNNKRVFSIALYPYHSDCKIARITFCLNPFFKAKLREYYGGDVDCLERFWVDTPLAIGLVSTKGHILVFDRAFVEKTFIKEK